MYSEGEDPALPQIFPIAILQPIAQKLAASPAPLAGMSQQHTNIARSAIMTSASTPDSLQNRVPDSSDGGSSNGCSRPGIGKDANLMPPAKTLVGRALGNDLHSDAHRGSQASKDGVGFALTDTPISTAPSSPQLYVPFRFFVRLLVVYYCLDLASQTRGILGCP